MNQVVGQEGSKRNVPWAPYSKIGFVWKSHMVNFRQSALTGHPTALFDSNFERFDYLEATIII